ncbi:hypothetical protein UK23_31325 [Lentzea aerocolonigenes]|uniref:Uncharacterized protein n=1 Tax=Lentzea aerocolonigenes TaxID=68170 RepID=A0A0F0GPP5_LENAE|nr:hypothetical protein [Lentzea aerocolonigenes]KJK43917.1 hypothetical protein UK23_31325 [Lentzea aerocolonigenes]
MATPVLLLVVLIMLAVVAAAVWSSRRTARRAETRSATAVEAAKLAIVTATTHQPPADLEQGRIRTFLMLDESSIMTMYSQTPQAAAEARIREVERGTHREGSLGLSGSLVEAGGKRSRGETVRETFEAETNAARALDVVLQHLAANSELTQVDLTLAHLDPAVQGYVKIKASFRITLRETDITVTAPGVRFSVPRPWVTASASAAFADGESITAICFGRTARWEDDTLVVLPSALYLA